jgi:hypothetical protein
MTISPVDQMEGTARKRVCVELPIPQYEVLAAAADRLGWSVPRVAHVLLTVMLQERNMEPLTIHDTLRAWQEREAVRRWGKFYD